MMISISTYNIHVHCKRQDKCYTLQRNICCIAIDLLEIFLMFVCVVQTLTLEDGRPGLVVTDLAENKVYMKFSNWWDQILLHGALPFLFLAVSNIRYGGGGIPSAMQTYYFVTGQRTRHTCSKDLHLVYLSIYVYFVICLEGSIRDNFYNEREKFIEL